MCEYCLGTKTFENYKTDFMYKNEIKTVKGKNCKKFVKSSKPQNQSLFTHSVETTADTCFYKTAVNCIYKNKHNC